MHGMINAFIKNLRKEDVNEFALNNNVYLSEQELNFTYLFVKEHGPELVKNPDMLDLQKYKSYYTEENFLKIEKLLKEYLMKFKNYL